MSSAMFREITPHSESIDRWNDLTINAGASQSTLQDIKIPDCAGCFTYFNSRDLSSSCSNRFIYWRTNHDIIELVEISLDVTLTKNHLRLRFQNTPILRGISIHEHRGQVFLLVPTVSAIHRLVFPHPKSLEKDLFRVSGREQCMPSIFHDISKNNIRSRCCSHVPNHVSLGIPLPHTACSWIDTNGSAAYILANSSGSVLLVTMSGTSEPEITTTELMKTGTLYRLFNGLVPSSMRSSRTEVALSIVCHKTPSDTFIFVVFSDLQIRVWSYRRQECILVDSVINYDIEKRLGGGNFTAHQCHLRKSESENGDIYVGVYIPIPHEKSFFIFKPVLVPEHIQLRLVTILHQASYDLVDFCIGNNTLWSLWLSCENQPVVFSADLEPELKTEHKLSWTPANLESQVSRVVDYTNCKPQDAYLREIFKVGRFMPSTIAKAISIYNASRNSSFSSNSQPKLEELKKWVIEALEAEILMKVGDIEGLDNGYIEVSAECWDRFFSYCIQYHEVGMKPLGISFNPNTGCVILIKKNFYSILSPCDSLDYIISPNFRSFFSISMLSSENQQMYDSFKATLACIELVRESVDQKMLMRFEDKLFTLCSPIMYASEIYKSLDLETENLFYRKLQSIMPSNLDVISCLNLLLAKLDISSEIKDSSDDNCTKYSSFANSSSGTGALCAGLAYFARQRFEFCRDLLIFELILYESDAMESEQLDHLLSQSNVIPKTVSLLRSYYTILWCTQCECVPVPSVIQDAAFKQFCLLDLPEFTNKDLTSISGKQTICHLFFQDDGGIRARKIMEMTSSSVSQADVWETLFPNLIRAAATLLWPLEFNVVFPEFLYTTCQHSPLEEYDRLLQDWCIGNKQFLNFLVASSCLIMGEPRKASKIFLDVSKEIERESLLCNKILKGHYSTGSSITSAFCMKVIQMYEQFSLSDCIVKLASTAILEIDEKDPHVPIFYSILFKHHLNLGHSEEAFKTLIKNPDSSRRKDCLRLLIVKLCELKEFQMIIELSYLAYEEEVISILESRARCSDLCHNTSFYGILYSLHINHKKFRKAAAVMYELAMRFGREVVSLKGLKKQVNCYLAAINCLHLAEPQYAWVVKPALNAKNEDQSSESRLISKRNSEGEEIKHASRPIKVEVLGLDDILQEYNLVQARLVHAQKYCNTSNLVITPLTAEETIALLLNAGLYDAAIKLSKSFSLPLIPVFEAFTYSCLSTNLRTETHALEDTDKERYHKQSDFGTVNTVIGIKGNTKKWQLLKKYLLEHEEPGKSDLHRCVTEKLLNHGSVLPAWLQLSYQKRNFTELLSLYISHGLLEESLNLLHKYIKAILGIRIKKEDFGLEFSLHINSPPVWLPHTYIDIIMDAASELSENKDFQESYNEFMKTLNDYNKTLESITESKLSNSAVSSVN